MNVAFLQSFGKRTALIIFLIGVLIFAFYYFTDDESYILLGVVYLLVAGLCTLVVLGVLLYRLITVKRERRPLLLTAGLVSINIPVAIFLLWFGGLLMHTIRLTITNSSGLDVSEVTIEGCQKKQIENIKAGESVNVWIEIPDECEIILAYRQADKVRREEAVGLVGKFGGCKKTHRIGTTVASGS